MAGIKTADERHFKTVSEVRNISVSFDDVLDSGEQMTGTPTILEDTTSDLTLDNKAVSTGSLVINNKTVTVGRALTFRVSGGTLNTEYKITLQCGTDSSPAQTLRGTIILGVIADV